VCPGPITPLPSSAPTHTHSHLVLLGCKPQGERRRRLCCCRLHVCGVEARAKRRGSGSIQRHPGLRVLRQHRCAGTVRVRALEVVCVCVCGQAQQGTHSFVTGTWVGAWLARGRAPRTLKHGRGRADSATHRQAHTAPVDCIKHGGFRRAWHGCWRAADSRRSARGVDLCQITKDVVAAEGCLRAIGWCDSPRRNPNTLAQPLSSKSPSLLVVATGRPF
jgi:hypothetical protein